jgi:hypothetical protein
MLPTGLLYVSLRYLIIFPQVTPLFPLTQVTPLVSLTSFSVLVLRLRACGGTALEPLSQLPVILLHSKLDNSTRLNGFSQFFLSPHQQTDQTRGRRLFVR